MSSSSALAAGDEREALAAMPFDSDELAAFTALGVTIKRGFVSPGLVSRAVTLVTEWYRTALDQDQLTDFRIPWAGTAAPFPGSWPTSGSPTCITQADGWTRCETRGSTSRHFRHELPRRNIRMRLISPNELDQAAKAIESNDLVILPTRRWYMICANASDHDACARVFSGKRRPQSKSLALVLPHAHLADDFFVTTPYARQLASAFWPGDLALILRWRHSAAGRACAPVGEADALVTMDPGPLGELARRSSVPVAATTANISPMTSPDTAGPAITIAEVQQFVADAAIEVAYCVDGGVCPLAHHLTIVDCTAAEARIARSGVIHDRAIAAVTSAVRPPAQGR